jgi:hypothetical protein
MEFTPEIIYNLKYALIAPGTAILSPDKKYRYVLTREWNKNGSKSLNFLMCNPSTADASILDPTVKKCVKWAVVWGYDRLIVTNVFAYRSTDVKQLYKVGDPIGMNNDNHLEETFEKCKNGLVVAAWGNNGTYLSRDTVAQALATKAGVNLFCLRTTKNGNPEHPLYLPKNLKSIIWKNNNENLDN